MKKIALIHKGSAFAPEIGVYKRILEKEGYFVAVFKEPRETDLNLFDIEWHFMGTDTTQRKPDRVKIHEYVSLSVPPFPKWKDRIKKVFNSTPDLRIFGSNFIEKELGFNDNVPARFRDAGVSPDFFQKTKNIIPEFDFVYSGSTDKTRNIGHLLSHFVENMPDKSFLVIGTPPPSLSKRILHHPAITFTGRIIYEEVPSWLQRARFGINFIPDIYPYNQQRPLKLLEYCAVGMPIITTEYAWVNQFEQERDARFFKLAPDSSNFKIDLIQGFNYKPPDVSDLTWEKQIYQSGILDFFTV